MALLIRFTIAATLAIGTGCARFDPSETIQLVPSTDWNAADIETLRRAAACWNLRFGTRFEVVHEPTAEQTVAVAYNPFTCWTAEGSYTYGQRAQIDVCPPESSRSRDVTQLWWTSEVRLFLLLSHELGHAAGIRTESIEPGIMGEPVGFGVRDLAFSRRELFGEEDARLLHDATGFVGTPECEGKTMVVAHDDSSIACGCEYFAPGEPRGGVAAYDVEHGYTLLYHAGESWTWDGVTWTRLAPAVAPPYREATAMAYDPRRKRVVLFGGARWNDWVPEPLGDTWEWNGAEWIETSPVVSPPPRWGHSLAFDEGRQRLVLFGGELATDQWTNDVWEYDGTTWIKASPIVSPPPRADAAFAFDPVRRSMVLFGGSRVTSGTHDQDVFADHWEWDGVNWSNVTLSANPGAWSYALLVRDATGKLALLGTPRTRPDPYPDPALWQWDGRRWSRNRFVFGPAFWSTFGVASDSARGRVVVVGDRGTWEWDGARWWSAGFRQCGNGRIEGSETCDDGNLAQGDDCDASCQLE